MSDYVEQGLQILKARGYRMTVPRLRILELLERVTEALNPYEIRDLLAAQRENVDISSIYRVLDCLETNNLVHRVLATGKYHKCNLDQESECHLEQADHCHHNVVCRSCGAVEEVHCPGLTTVTHRVEQQSRFRIDGHQLEFQGLCGNCA